MDISKLFPLWLLRALSHVLLPCVGTHEVLEAAWGLSPELQHGNSLTWRQYSLSTGEQWNHQLRARLARARGESTQDSMGGPVRARGPSC